MSNARKDWASTVEFCGDGSGRCDGDRSTKPGGEENFAVSLAGIQQKKRRQQEELAIVAGRHPTPVLLSVSRLPVFAPALDDQVQHGNEK